MCSRAFSQKHHYGGIESRPAAGPHGMSLTLKIEDLSVLFVAPHPGFRASHGACIRAADENASFV
jgi:hypothetical protein